MSLAFRCHVCDGVGWWRFDRHGDAVQSWACPEHVHEVMVELQRPHEITQLTVQRTIDSTLVADSATAALRTEGRQG